MTAQGDQLARVLGPGWQTMRYSQLDAHAHTLEQAATFTRTLADYIIETGGGTAGAALERLLASRADAEEWRALHNGSGSA